MSLSHLILLEKQKQELLGDKSELKALNSKIEGLNSYLDCLIQKKLRIELEIQSSKRKLSKLKKYSKTKVKLTTSLESLLPGQYSQVYGPFLDEEFRFEISRNGSLLEQTDRLLQELSTMSF